MTRRAILTRLAAWLGITRTETLTHALTADDFDTCPLCIANAKKAATAAWDEGYSAGFGPHALPGPNPWRES